MDHKRALVIVESPAKAKTINKFLGKSFIVKSCVGHIRDLPYSGSARSAAKSGGKKKATRKKTPEEKEAAAQAALVRRMAVDPENDWKAHYEIVPGKEKILAELKSQAERADVIYLATDLDREGEAIAWHLKEAIGGPASRFRRVTFGEITKRAIQEAFKSPGKVNTHRVQAQQARRFLDRVVGFMVSPLLWKKVARGLSAGRVQSVATRLVTEREAGIRAFIPEEYWEIHGEVASSKLAKDIQIPVAVSKVDGRAFRPTSETETMAANEAILAADLALSERIDKPAKSRPSAPYITTTLQQGASVRLGFGVKKTMMLAQRLYEAGHITYMRTDATHLSPEAIEACRAWVESSFGAEYLPKEPVVYSSKDGAQEAHEAIRPSDVAVEAEALEGIDEDGVKLYRLIWRQFVACQMAPAEFDTTSLVFTADAYVLRARGRVIRFDGFQRIQPPMRRKGDEDRNLPDLAVGDPVNIAALMPTQHFTKPPPRFTEASLVRELEKQGIGRPSTYASIISTIQERGYVRTVGRRFFAQKMGDIVTERLSESFAGWMDYGFTAAMEEKLDRVASGDSFWKDVLDEFYRGFKQQLEVAGETMRLNEPTETDVLCPQCERPMAVRTARTGVFLSCTGYALPVKERCKSTINLIPGEEAEAVPEAQSAGDEDQGEREVAELRQKQRCPQCGTAMDSYLIDEARKLHVCGRNPECSGFAIEAGQFRIRGYDGPIVECDKCGKDMQLKTGRFGKYFGCTAYPDCKNSRKLLRNGEAAPPRADPIPMPELLCTKSDSHFVLRDGAAGIFLAASNYPRTRETKNPKVEDLVRHRSELDPKYVYLADGPAEDSKGNPSIIRFSRKTKEHYLMTEVEGKATGWTAYFEGGQWLAREAVKKAPVKKKATAKKKATKKKATKKKATTTKKAAAKKTTKKKATKKE